MPLSPKTSEPAKDTTAPDSTMAVSIAPRPAAASSTPDLGRKKEIRLVHGKYIVEVPIAT